MAWSAMMAGTTYMVGSTTSKSQGLCCAWYRLVSAITAPANPVV